MSTLQLDGFFVDVTLRRPDSGGTYAKGEWQDASSTDTIIKGSIQPLSGNELLQLEEGERTRELRKIYTFEELKTASEGADQTESDIIIYNGQEYEVIKTLPYLDPGPYIELPHCKAIIARKDKS